MFSISMKRSRLFFVLFNKEVLLDFSFRLMLNVFSFQNNIMEMFHSLDERKGFNLIRLHIICF